MVVKARLGEADPTLGFKFTVAFDGVDSVGFSKISGLKASVKPFRWTECTELISPRKLPDVAEFGPVTFERGLTTNSYLYQKMAQLFDLGRGGTAGFGAYAGFKKVVIHLPWNQPGAASTADPGSYLSTGESGNVLHGFILHYAWPIGLEAEPLDAQASKVLIHKLTVACEGISFV